jgi:hypothetical protein
MSIEAFVIVLSLIAACGGITVTLLTQAQVATARAVDHVDTINALACPWADERARPPR